jgi:hypothetical protein
LAWPTQQGTFDAGDLTLQSGAVLRGARLSWKAHGTLPPARDNVVVCYQLRRAASDLEWLIRPDGVLDPTRWFIVIPDMFGNGLSSSPRTPRLSVAGDDPRQRADPARALREAVRHRACRVRVWLVDGSVAGLSLGGIVPDSGGPIVVNCGVARTAVHNQVFLRSLMATLESRTGAHRRWSLLGRAACGQAGVPGASMRRGRSARISIVPGCIWRRDRSPILARPDSGRRSCAPTGRIGSGASAINQYAQLRTGTQGHR